MERLSSESIEGVLIKTHEPRYQGTVKISIDDDRKNERGSGIGLDDSGYSGLQDGFHIDVFMGSEWYQRLKRYGMVGLRQRMRDGSKILIYDISILNSFDAMRVESLEFYRDNKDKL